jgi:hypothetical protein
MKLIGYSRSAGFASLRLAERSEAINLLPAFAAHQKTGFSARLRIGTERRMFFW